MRRYSAVLSLFGLQYKFNLATQNVGMYSDKTFLRNLLLCYSRLSSIPVTSLPSGTKVSA